METYNLYDNEIILTFDPAKHLYTVNGQRVHGCTSALNVLAKPALIPWAVNMAIEHLQQYWQAGQSYDEIQIKDILNEAKRAHTQKKTDAADKGTLAHLFLEQWIKGKNPPLPVNEELRNACNAFLSWTKENNVKFLKSEVKVYSKQYNYAGTLDFTASVNGKIVVGDIKTSSGIYPEMFFQTAAYQQALQEEFPWDEHYQGNLIVRCGKDGTLEIKESTEFEKNIKAFLGALALYDRQQTLKDEQYKQLL